MNTVHNLHYYLQLMQEMRDAIDAGTFQDFVKKFKTARARLSLTGSGSGPAASGGGLSRRLLKAQRELAAFVEPAFHADGTAHQAASFWLRYRPWPMPSCLREAEASSWVKARNSLC
jgi:hypothetical protein